MTEIEPTEPTVEWWAYGGVRVPHTERMVAWLPDSGNGEELLLLPIRFHADA
jgi:hypothetical protein